ncbi:MAG: hypothetical protein E1N59_1903 [Puniceicoccaceae bacterium 5H]|nr:MAG: hypothetical protein E1N59_1903 [Puniceicoccaceae bacterium 5H]
MTLRAFLPLLFLFCPTLPIHAAAPAPVIPAEHLTLIDEVSCGEPDEQHRFQDYPAGISQTETILGRPARTLPNDRGDVKYFAYRLGEGKGLQAGQAYLLEVDYPEDAPRTIFVLNRGCETQRGFHTGQTVGDALHGPYVFSNPESLALPLSDQWQTFRMAFHLHDRFPGIPQPKTTEYPRPMTPEDGFWVLIAQFAPRSAPQSAGAAVGSIRLYAVSDYEDCFAPIHYPPTDLPRRHLFSRDEMADMVVTSEKRQERGVDRDIDWFRYRAQTMKLLGFNTYTVDLLEFGHVQGWDPASYGGDDWYPSHWNKDRWQHIVAMATDYGFDLLPYYEYSGSRGKEGLGVEKRARPLTRDDAFTRIPWTENARADLTDPATFEDFRKVLAETVVKYRDEAHFAGIWLRPPLEPTADRLWRGDAAALRQRHPRRRARHPAGLDRRCGPARALLCLVVRATPRLYRPDSRLPARAGAG